MPPSPLRTGVGLPEEYAALPEGLPVIRASRKMNRDAAVAPSLLPLTEPQKQASPSFFASQIPFWLFRAFAPAPQPL